MLKVTGLTLRLSICVALAFASATIMSGCADSGDNAPPSDTIEGTPVPAVVPLDVGSWAEVVLIDGGSYYGLVTAAPDGFLALETPYYPLGATDDAEAVTLRGVGSEFHRPDRVLLVPLTSVVRVQQLSAESRVVSVIKGDLATLESEEVDVSGLADLPVAGVFLTSGRLLFGHVAVRGDGWVSIEGAHRLVRNPDTDVTQPIESLDDLVLVPENDEDVGRVGDVFILQEDVLMIESMSEESPVVGALGTAAE